MPPSLLGEGHERANAEGGDSHREVDGPTEAVRVGRHQGIIERPPRQHHSRSEMSPLPVVWLWVVVEAETSQALTSSEQRKSRAHLSRRVRTVAHLAWSVGPR